MDNDKCCNVMRDFLGIVTRTSKIGLTIALASTQAKTMSIQNNTRADSVRWIVDLLQLHRWSYHYSYPTAFTRCDCIQFYYRLQQLIWLQQLNSAMTVEFSYGRLNNWTPSLCLLHSKASLNLNLSYWIVVITSQCSLLSTWAIRLAVVSKLWYLKLCQA